MSGLPQFADVEYEFTDDDDQCYDLIIKPSIRNHNHTMYTLKYDCGCTASFHPDRNFSDWESYEKAISDNACSHCGTPPQEESQPLIASAPTQNQLNLF